MKMMVEYAERPIAVAVPKPRFSWEVPLSGRNRRQIAYQILVASNPDLLEPDSTDLWDSGKVQSNQSVNIEYGGSELAGNTDYYWSVRIWDEAGSDTGFSAPEYFATAFMDESDWKARWIGMGNPQEPFADPAAFQHNDFTPDVINLEPDLRTPLLRKEFVLDKPVKRARAFICGLGLFELRLNGRKVGDDVSLGNLVWHQCRRPDYPGR